MEHHDFVTKYLKGSGVEIGAFKTPIPGIKPIYVDRFAEYAGERTLADYYGDACELPFHPDTVQYVASSHVLEHVANPYAALVEWVRVVKSGGYIYMVIPDRRKTFDRPRPLTPVTHLLEDFRNRVTQCDGQHIDDFVFGVDWTLFSPATPASEERAARESLALTYRRSVDAGLEINIHFHTFESQSAVEFIEQGNREKLWDGRVSVTEIAEAFPASNPIGFLIVARVEKPWVHRVKANFATKGVKPNARKF